MSIVVTKENLEQVLNKGKDFRTLDQEFRSLLTLFTNPNQTTIAFSPVEWRNFVRKISAKFTPTFREGITFEDYINGDESIHRAWEIISQRKKV